MNETKPLGYSLGLSLRVFLSQAEKELRNKQIEITFDQYVMLRMIDANCNLIQQDIANHLQKDKSLVVRQMDGLIEKKYVIRTRNTVDKRKKNLVLTTKGIEIMKNIQKINFEVSDRLLAGVSESDYEIFLQVLTKIWENGGIDENFGKNKATNI
jgi:DNA-binding MarR family transcriptional regulator